MRRAAALLALALAGCPIPQPLPDYPAGTITPPRILQASLWPSGDEPVIRVGAGCVDPPAFTLEAQISDTISIEQVVARWFVNYAPFDGFWSPVEQATLSPNEDPTVLTRPVPPYVFRPFSHRPPLGTGTFDNQPFNEPGTVRVVDLVVSNSFHEPGDEAVPPFRGAAANFETQLHRWTFLIVNNAVDNCGPQARPIPTGLAVRR